MLEEKLVETVKSVVRSARPYLVAASLAFGAYSCGDECEHDADCPEGEYCGESCSPGKYTDRGFSEPICNQICKHEETTYVPD